MFGLRIPDDVVQARVCELCGSIVVVDKVDASGDSAADLPADR